VSHTVLYLPNLSTLTKAGGFIVRITLLAVAMTFFGSVLPLSAQAVIQHYQLNIPKQPLDTALKDFAHQTGLQVARMSDAVDGSAIVGPIRGDLSAEEALKSLLGPRGLTYKLVNERTIAIVNPGAEPTSSSALSKSAEKEGAHSSGNVEDSKPGDRLQLAQTPQGSPTSTPSVDASSRERRGGEDSSSKQAKLEEIVVTAEKRTERAQDVPASIAVLSASQLEDQGAVQLSDYAKQVPGLTLIGDSGAGRGVAVLRGVSAGSGSSPLVGVYLDDVPMTPSSPNSNVTNYGGTFDPDLADIERIEVLEGPQSTLYGASAMGGVVKFVTKQPDLNDFAGSVRIDGSQVDGGGAGYGMRGSANVPIVADTIGLRASAFYRDDPGFVDSDFTGAKNINHDSVKGARLSLRVRFTEDLESTLSALVQNIDRSGPNLVYLNPATLRPALGSLAYSSPIAQPNTVETRSVSDTTTLNMHFATLTNIASYANVVGHVVVDNSSDGSYLGAPPGVFVYNAGDLESQRFSDEIRLASFPGQFEWLLGGFYTDERDPDDVYIRGTDSVGMTLPSSSPYYNVYTYINTSIFKERAIFGDLTYHLTNQIEGTVGMRYSSNDQSFSYVESGSPLFTASPPCAPCAGSSSDSAKTYLITITYKPTSEMSAYVRAASAYRPGGPNLVNGLQIAQGAPPTFGPDKLWNYEAGLKGAMWNQRITYTADVYHMDWTNIQLNVTDQLGATFLANASSAKSDGVEASIQFAPVDGLTVRLSGAYTDAKLTSDVPAPTNAAKGTPLPFAPKTAAAAVLDYRWTVFNTITPRAGLTYTYHGSEHTAFTTTGAGYVLPSYETLDLRGGFDWSRYSLIGRVDNVTNKYALSDAEPTFAFGSPLGGIVIKPRTFGISLQARF
jgi:iron complex outermembrane receptor protein